uniref:Uncharacterized protein n=1 Tax=Ciona intestinalis TaxID=7719 RepID=H2XMF5_CIOIN
TPEKRNDLQNYIHNPYDNFMKRHLQHYGYYTGIKTTINCSVNISHWRRLTPQATVMNSLERMDKLLKDLVRDTLIIFNDIFVFKFIMVYQLLFTVNSYFKRKIPKLREPRNLYALTKEAGPQQATRWPSHMQVVCPAIRFLEYNPPIPDPLYKHTGKEPTPAVRGPQLGEMIYYNDPGRDLYFMRSRVAGCRLAMVSTTLTPREYPEDNLTLEFESRFESGNLLKVDKLTPLTIY